MTCQGGGSRGLLCAGKSGHTSATQDVRRRGQSIQRGMLGQLVFLGRGTHRAKQDTRSCMWLQSMYMDVMRASVCDVWIACTQVAAAAATGRASAAAATCVLSPTELTQQVLQDPTLDVPRHYLQVRATLISLLTVLCTLVLGTPAAST